MSDGYEILGRVATTASGVVWKARDRALDRLVALKEIALAAAAHEVQALVSLRSVHVVEVYGIVEDGAHAYLIEEWVEGATLAAVLRSSGPLSERQALGVIRGALLGLAVAHRAGVVHGDVSVSNILIATDGAAKLIDFGSVARVGEAARAWSAAFEAPEIAAGHAVTPAADVYSAAAVLAMLLHGRTDLQPSTRGIDEPVRGVLDRALSALAGNRYPDAAALLVALDAAAEQRYGVLWWTDAGLGALAGASTAALAVVAAGVPFSAAEVVAGADATPPPAPAAAPKVALVSESRAAHGVLPSRKVLIGTGVGVAAAIGAVVVAVVASSGGNDKPSAASLSSLPSTATTTIGLPPGSLTSTSTPAAPSTAYFAHVHVTVRYSVLKDNSNGRLKPSGSITLAKTHPYEDFVQDSGRIELGGDDGKTGSGNSLVVSGTLPVGTYQFEHGAGDPADAFGALGLRIPFTNAALNASSGGGEVFVAGFGKDAPSPDTCTLTIAKADSTGMRGTMSCPRVSVAGGASIAGLTATFSFAP